MLTSARKSTRADCVKQLQVRHCAMLAFFLFFSFFAGDLFCHITQTLLSPVLSWSGLTTSTQGTVQAVVCRAGCTAYKAACRSVVTVTPSRLTCYRECQYLQVSTFTYSVARALLYFFFSLSLSLLPSLVNKSLALRRVWIYKL